MLPSIIPKSLSNKFRLPVLVLLFIVQLSVPAAMMMKYEDVLTTGELYKFRAAAVDPYDPFRGRYVTINLEVTTVDVAREEEFKYGETAYALLTRGKDGFAQVAGLSADEPDDGRSAVRVTVGWTDGVNRVRVNFPFTRYYMDEFTAPHAEKILWDRENREKVHLEVRVKNTVGVIENVIVKGQSLTKLARESLNNAVRSGR